VVAGLMAFLFVMLPLRLLLPDVGWSA
jgi:hypothetical protein